VSEALTKAQAEQLKLLRAADDGGTLKQQIARGLTEFSRDILRELYDDGMLTGGKFLPVDGPAEYTDLKITLRGRDRLAELEQFAVPDHAPDPASGAAEREVNHPPKPLVKFAWTVGAIVVGAATLYLFRHHLGIPL
jgi:hypothetical protein